MAKRPAQPKPPPGTAAGRRAALIAAAVIVVGIGIVVVVNRDGGDDAEGDGRAMDRVVDLLPEPLASDEIRATGLDPATDAPMPELEAGGWIQIVDRDTGKLAQQYRFARLDPTPEGLPANWVRMDEPHADIYLADNRVVRLSGDSALVHLPHRVLESGSLTGNVLIEVFEPPPQRRLDTTRDDPVLVVHAPEAAFDNVMGEVTCPDRFRVESPSAEFLGSGLSLLINDQTEPVRASMEVASLEYARFAQGALQRGPEPAAPADTPVPAREAPGPETPAAGADAAGKTTPTGPVQHYELRLRDNVKIQEGIGARVVTGDALVVLFSSESEGFSSATPPARTTPSPAIGALPARMATAVFGQVGADEIVKQPQASRFVDRSIAPPIRDNDLYVTCTGGLSLVPVDDPEREAQLRSPRDSWLMLTGAPVTLLDRTRDARATCDRVTFRGSEQTIRLVGSDTHPLSVTSPQVDAAGEVFWLRRGGGGFSGPGSLTSVQGRDAEPVELAWNGGLDLDFDDAAAASTGALGTLRRAAFRGEVVARNADSSLSCHDRMIFDLETDTQGATAPTLLTATGEVRASDPDQTMWSDRLEVTFRERDDRAAPPPEVDPGLPVASMGAGGRVDEVTAEGDVQVLLSDGARVFADRLHADAVGETVELTGADVAIADRQWLIDDGRAVVLDKASGTALWDGPGVARMFGADLPIGADARIDRRSLPARHRSRATWNGSMRYGEPAGEDGRGVIDLDGGVEMVSEPGPFQRTTFGGDHVSIELARRGSDRRPTAGTPAGEGRTALGRVIGRGGARLEQRRWATEARVDEPRIFFVSGERLEYDETRGEALVPGPGELLVRDLRPAAGGDDDADAFGGRGTTSFRWKTKLQMTRRDATLYDIAMVDGIEMRHLDLDGQTMTLTCRRIDATIDRPEGTGVDRVDGPADLQHVRAAGAVFLRAPTRDVDCDLLDYDVRAGEALISADPGRVVTIFTRGAPQPVKLTGARWNLATDEMTARSGTAGGTR